jgi:beta-barrel assembly-enhancing protease
VSPLKRRHCAAAVSIALSVSGFAAVPQSYAAAAPDPAIHDERLEASYNASSEFVQYPVLDRYLAQVVRRLQDANPDAASIAVRIHALNYALPYAFVLGNGAAYVSTGLIARLDNESQLAAVIAMPLAALVRHDDDKLSADQRRRAQRSLVPNILLIAVTAGFAGPSLAKSNRLANESDQSRLQAASDTVALQWLANAGYEPSGAPAALRLLQDRLSAEQRSGTSDLSDPAQLPLRAEALDHALSEIDAPSTTKPPVDPTGNFGKLSLYYAQQQAAVDLDAHPASVAPILDRLDAEHGASGVSLYLRAELVRRNSEDPVTVPAAIDAYERCVAHSDAPPAAYRELAFLYRRAGDTERARKNFTAYLAHSPNASDAPIIRSYLENP